MKWEITSHWTNIQKSGLKIRDELVVKLKNSDRYRIRVGDYRVIYEINDDKLIVILLRCKHRKDAYTQS